MENMNWWKIAVIAIIALFLFGSGFYIGRKKDPDVVIKRDTTYVELPPIHDSIPKPVPYKVVEPIDTANVIMAAILDGMYDDLFPEKTRTDTIYISKADTAAVLKDWATERRYAETLFDSKELGKFTFDATVKYNRLANFDYTFTPVQMQTETTVKSVRKFLPYIGAGFDSGMGVLGQGGVFFHQDAGFAVQYRYDTQLKQSTYGGLFLYMF